MAFKDKRTFAIEFVPKRFFWTKAPFIHKDKPQPKEYGIFRYY